MEIEILVIDNDADIWTIEMKIIPRKRGNITYWYAKSQNKKKESIRSFSLISVKRKINKIYGKNKKNQ